MIFLSYNHNDKDVVKPLANKLASVFSSENIFFDDWSIQPGDGIIASMNKGLDQTKYFFFFVSKHSLQSKMVDLEWQNALLKATRGDLKLIPIKLDDCLMPAILLQTSYIDLFGKGLEVAFRQMVDVINQNNEQPDISQQTYENVRAFISKNADKINIEIRAMTYMAPQSRFAILVSNEEADFGRWEKGAPMFQGRFQEKVAQLTNGNWANALYFERQRPLSPGFPYVLEISEKQGKKLNLIEVMHASDEKFYRFIPRQIE
ncbi:toll/interleukin-1 receptor domain-containing protein [uncultured Psychrosphaera sp.]|uniref:toll/interleukin-1 receptor domain-containing protein n=1 Tax=uncultured Psychrosphaera sp. TaxID=1403522 RepID=UPI002627DCD0|nr:toll/interleukin-1 receptor domain-containing protein [uncultured Psychrosphaera sp.]